MVEISNSTPLERDGPIHGTSLIGTTGLWLAIAETREGLQQAKVDLEKQMSDDNLETGVIILSQKLAATTFGPVPKDWLDLGISMHRSTEDNTRAGAFAFLNEVSRLRKLMEESFVELDAIANSERE